MILDELKKVVEQFNNQGKMRFLVPASEDQISEFERNNDIKLPVKYREWLLFSDGGELFLPAGLQLYGVVQKPVINIHDDDRPDNNYIVIGSLASGDPILCEKNNEKISIYNHEAGIIEEDETYDDFYAFLSDLYNLLGIGD